MNGQCSIVSLPWALQVVQNSAGDAGATGWWAALFVAILLFLDKEFRAQPRKLLDALAESGVTISTCLMFLAVTVIDVCLNFTGLSKFVAIDVLRFLLSFELGEVDLHYSSFCTFNNHVASGVARHGDACCSHASM